MSGKLFGHLHTITKHRNTVMRHCFKAGLIWRGLMHDWSKYSPAEFFPGVKFYQGNRSPQAREREVYGYSAAWLHHKGRNKHHFEYWNEWNGKEQGERVFVDMPCVYFAEMVCDRVAASKIYMKKEYTDSAPLEYYRKRTDIGGMHPDTAARLDHFLSLLSEKGEKAMFAELKAYVKEGKKKEKAEKKDVRIRLKEEKRDMRRQKKTSK
ncbi:MAG: DUF5662 family protein [Clostridia bacterium]|nr:DUF5662 family protein [Clostridia bacterium]